MKHSYAMLALLVLGSTAQAQTTFYEGFDDVDALPGAGWILTNHSEPLGTDSWAQADGAMVALAHSGDSTSYAQSSFEATDADGTGTISDWMVTPPVMLNDGDMIRLYALSYNSAAFPDRLEVRISMNGGSDIGTESGDVGDFTTLVFSVNENLDTVSFPSFVNDEDWTAFEGAVSGLGSPTSCRIAVRYYVWDAGGTGVNSSTVGVDDLEVYSGQSNVGLHELRSAGASVSPNPANEQVTLSFHALHGPATLVLTDMTGQVHRSIPLGAIERRSYTLDTRALASGAYTLAVVQEGMILQQRLVVTH